MLAGTFPFTRLVMLACGALIPAPDRFLNRKDKAAEKYEFVSESKPATAFLFKLIAMLQFSGTVPMIDIDAYSDWLTK